MKTAPNDECVFCRIIQGAIPSHAIYEDDQTLAFLDINPAPDGLARIARAVIGLSAST